jgi:hypothetical protein
MQHDALRLVNYYLCQRGRELARRLLKGKGLPLGALLSETLGQLVGPLAYVQSLRQVHSEQPEHRLSAQALGLQLDGSLPIVAGVEENHD